MATLQDTESMEIENEPIIQDELNENNASTEDDEPDIKKNLDDWTKEEKYMLYLGIKHKGSRNIEAIQENIPTKTLQEIEAAIAYYKRKANQNPDCTNRKLKIKKVRTKQLIPLARWAKILTDNYTYNELQTETISALRLIADLDDIPSPTCTEQIDFREVYRQIANAMEGKSLTNNILIAEVLHSCILETALLSKRFINVTTFKNIISSVDFKETPMEFPKPTKDWVLTIIRHLASQGRYNPLGIPEDNLLPTSNAPAICPE